MAGLKLTVMKRHMDFPSFTAHFAFLIPKMVFTCVYLRVYSLPSVCQVKTLIPWAQKWREGERDE